jgi:nucleolar protein 12
VFTSADAARAAQGLNNTLIEGRHLRVDKVREDGRAKYDPKRTVFVGQVHFEAGEEELRALFAGRVSGGDASIEAVRLVRDPATMRGKGIAYVLFRERTHVAEALGLHGTTFRKRTLRVTRCVDSDKAAPVDPAVAARKRVMNKSSAGRRDAYNPNPSRGGGFGGGYGRDTSRPRHGAGSSDSAGRAGAQEQRGRPRSAPGATGAGASAAAPSAAAAGGAAPTHTKPRATSAGGGARSAGPPPAKRPAFMGSTGDEIARGKVEGKAAAERKKQVKAIQARKGHAAASKARSQGGKGAGKPSAGAGKPAKSILKTSGAGGGKGKE